MIGLLIYYFNTKTRHESKHFVEKNEERIQVALSNPEKKKSEKPTPKKEVPSKPKSVSKPKPKPAPKKKEAVKKPQVEKKVVKKAKNVPKKKELKTTKPKKVNKPKNLFADISSSKPKKPSKEKVKPAPVKPKMDIVKVKEKSSAAELVSSSLKNQKTLDRGVENAYLAKIEEKLKGWPAQSDYVGERARVMIEVEPSGRFTFRVISASSIPEFNQGLNAYLKQLQLFGFGPHKGDRAYKLDVEFIATE
ncbi:MAG: TonB C-terminal domain-containing protein [Sulfurovum sp.]